MRKYSIIGVVVSLALFVTPALAQTNATTSLKERARLSGDYRNAILESQRPNGAPRQNDTPPLGAPRLASSTDRFPFPPGEMTAERLDEIVKQIKASPMSENDKNRAIVEFRTRFTATSTQQIFHPKQARAEVFNIQKTNLINQLNLAIKNLGQVRNRISARIDKATAAGRDMAAAKALLVTADGKISAAKAAISALSSYTPDNSAASSTVIDLTKPRQVGDAAIKAVKDARKALNDVVISIAHSLGLKLSDGNKEDNNSNASSTNQ